MNKQAQVTNGANNPLCVFIWALDLWLLGEAQRKNAREKLQFKWRQMEAALVLSAIIIISVTSDAHSLFKAAQELKYKLTAECLIHNCTVQ